MRLRGFLEFILILAVVAGVAYAIYWGIGKIPKPPTTIELNGQTWYLRATVEERQIDGNIYLRFPEDK